MKAPLQSSSDLLTFCQFHGNTILPSFQLQDNRRHSRRLCLISWEYSKEEEFKSSKIEFTHVSGKRKVDKPLQIASFRPLGLSTYHGGDYWTRTSGLMRVNIR